MKVCHCSALEIASASGPAEVLPVVLFCTAPARANSNVKSTLLFVDNIDWELSIAETVARGAFALNDRTPGARGEDSVNEPAVMLLPENSVTFPVTSMFL
jgi:hypothetical protein